MHSSTMMMTAATTRCPPPQDKYLGPQESCSADADPSSFLMYPPPNKKAKFTHHHADDNHGHNSREGAQHIDENNEKDRQILSSSPTDVLSHPTAGIQNGIFPAAVVKTLPPSLKGIAEAARGLNTSLRNSHNNSSSSSQQKSSPPSTRPQLVAFPTEALYVLTCCVKTTSKKKIIRANAAAVATAAASSRRNHDDSATSSSSSSVNSSVRERQDSGGESSCVDDVIHPSNPSLECLLSRQTLPNQEAIKGGTLSSRASVFVIDSKHAQHYCQFSPPKIFAIRPKQNSAVQSDGPSSLAAVAANSGGDMGDSVSKKGGGSKLGQFSNDEKELGLDCTNDTYAPSSPIESSSTTRAGERRPECAMVQSTSSSSLCVPMTPNIGTSNGISLSTSSVAAVTPIANNSTIPQMNEAKMPPSLPISSPNNPSNNHTLGTSKILAVNFSESYEAFSRLANKFWPGPMIIYAPSRMISAGNRNTSRMDPPSPSPLQQQSHSWTRSSSTASSSSSSSCPSLPSFTNLCSLEKGEAAAAAANNSQEVPVLPPSVLISAKDLLFDNDDGANTTSKDQFFIGMQCPSHPLARKILTEMYRPRRGHNTTSPSSSPSPSMALSPSTESLASMSTLDASTTTKQKQHVRCGIAVVGSYIAGYSTSDGSGGNKDETKGNTTPVLANNATNVTKILSASPSPSNGSNRKRGTEQIYIVNGEDTTHENFSVPTCNYGGVSPMSLVVDGDNRTIYLLRRHDPNSELGGHNNIDKVKIYRALLQPPSAFKSATAVNVDSTCSSSKASSTNEMDRVITAVLSRWKVVERHV